MHVWSQDDAVSVLVRVDLRETETLPLHSFSVDYAPLLGADKHSRLARTTTANHEAFLLGKDTARSFQKREPALIRLRFLPLIPLLDMRKHAPFLIQKSEYYTCCLILKE